MGRPKQVSDDEILRVAREAWLSDPRTPTSWIAKKVGLSEAAIFKRFRTKVVLMLRALGVHTAPPWVEIVDQGPDDRPIEDQLLEVATVMEAFFRKIIPRISVMKGIGLTSEDMFGDDPDPPPMVGIRALTGWFARAQQAQRIDPAHDPQCLAISFIGTFQGRAFWKQLFQDRLPVDSDAYLRQVVQVYARGLNPPESAP